MAELTALLNSTIQAGDTQIDAALEDELLSLDDGTYKVGNGTLTIATTEDDLDSITGTWAANSTTLTDTDWFSGTETASQELIDFVTGWGEVGVYFAYDTDTVVFNSGPRTSVDTIYWDGAAVQYQTFASSASVNYATDFTEGSTSAIWDTNKQSVLGLELFGSDNLNLTIM